MEHFIKDKPLISEEWPANSKIDVMNDDTINNPDFFHVFKNFVKSNYNSYIK